ncbi:phage protein GP20 [uncultured Mediterranean phage uvMED]|nr:phage protein GP20 [uncultured Mediterranean phage uvMED]
MSDENKTEQVEQSTTETVETKQEQPVEQPKPSQFDIDKVVKDRLYRQEKQLLESLGVNDITEAKAAIEERKKVEEEKQLERGKFDEVMKKKTLEYNEKLSKLEQELKSERVDKQLINAASKHRAISPDQIKELMKNQVQLNQEGKVEVLDNSGTPRYNKEGDLLTVDEAVQEFLTQNAHFQAATPAGSGSVSNVGKSTTQKTLNVADLDMSNPDDRKMYAEYRKQRDSVTQIKLNK